MDVPRLVTACGEATEMCRAYGCTIDVEIGKGFNQPPVKIKITPFGAAIEGLVQGEELPPSKYQPDPEERAEP